MTLTLRQFSQRMYGLSKRVDSNCNELVKDAARKFFTTVVERTPVDTGLAISNWRVGLNYTPYGFSGPYVVGVQGSSKGANIASVLSRYLPTIEQRRTGQTISIVNTAPHIEKLNQGHSSQAPAGFIEAAHSEAEAIIKGRNLLK